MKIAVFVPSYRHSPASCADAILVAVNEAQRAGHEVIHLNQANCLVEVARNACVGVVTAHPMFDGTDYVLFIDDDMKPEPDAINKIVAHGAPIASPLLTTRAEPVELLVKRWDFEKRCFLFRENFKTSAPSIGPYCTGAAFLCIRRDVLETVKEFFLSARDWMEWKRPEMDRLRVRSEARESERQRKEALRRKNYARDPRYLELFAREVLDDECRASEDLSFFWRVVQCGFETTIDPTIRVTHTGERDFHWEDYAPPSERELMSLIA